MFERRKYISAALSVFYPTFAGINVNTDRIAEIVQGSYFPPSITTGSTGAQIMTMLSEHGHSQISVGQDSITLLVTFSAAWEKDGTKGLDYAHQRKALLLPILEQMTPRPKLLYAGAGFTVRLQADDPKRAIGDVLAQVIAGNERSDSQDVSLRTTRVLDEYSYLNTTIGTYRQWGANMFSAPYVRLPLGLAVEAGIEVTVDLNSRLAFNESREITVDAQLLTNLVDRAFQSVEREADVIEKGERYTL